MGEIERDAVVLQALHDVAGQAAGIGHQLDAGQHFGALQRQAAGHDQADVAGPQNDGPAAHHVALDVHKTLGRAGGKDAGRALAGDGDGAAGALAAAHGQHHRLGRKQLIALFAVDGVDLVGPAVPAGHQLQHHRVQPDFHAGLFQQADVAAGVLRAGQLLAKAVQAEAVVDALVQNAAQLAVPLQNQHPAQALLPGLAGGGKAGGAAADDDQLVVCLIVSHGRAPPWRCSGAVWSRRTAPSCRPGPSGCWWG